MSPSGALHDGKAASFSRSTWAEIDLDALRHNTCTLASMLEPNTAIIAVVKANAYGHGAVPVARALLEVQPHLSMLAVASVDEGLQLREAGITAPILLLSAILPEEARAAVRGNLVPTVFTRELAVALDEAGAAEGCRAEAHLKIDTGMGRLGVWHREAAEFYQFLQSLPHLHISGIYTHFACADDADDTMTEMQLQAFQQALQECSATPRSLSGVVIHAANSAALLRYPATRLSAVRLGLSLYGIAPVPPEQDITTLRPVMTLKSRITHIKSVPPGATISYGATWRAPNSACIATVPIGYADGYPRCLSNRAQVLIHHTLCPVVGRVTMDQILVDCSQIIANLHIGDSVTLFGPGLPVQQVAAWAETIPYEILCGVAHRVPRVYLSKQEKVKSVSAVAG